ncbi:MAG: hypothetical protein LBC06_01660 [Rickettsiales bacterium]|jgi:hypothetical protein|nr:hypothetical protein [Rickettsiales bacterium]
MTEAIILEPLTEITNQMAIKSTERIFKQITIPTTLITKETRVKKYLKKYYRKHENEYFERASEDVGIWEDDYYAPDGYCLADTSGWENEDEICERALEIYLEELDEGDWDLIVDIACEFAESEEEANEIEKYIRGRSYDEFKKILY